MCLFNISHFSSINNIEAMSKRTQEDAGEERVTAKSKPMMNLVSRCNVRDPNVLASIASESPGKTKSESQILLSSWNEQQPSNAVWDEKLSWFKNSPQHRTLDTIDGELMEFEWNIFPGFTTLQLINKVHEFMTKMGEPSELKGRIIFMSMFNDTIWGYEDNETECIANSTLVSLFAKRFTPGRWSFLGPGSEKKWYSTCNERPQGEWDRVAESMMIRFGGRTPSIPSHESIVSRNAQMQRRWKIIFSLLCRWGYD